MNQVLHIFLKDVRKHRLEIAASLLLLLDFGWKSPILWNENRTISSQSQNFLFALLGVTLVLSWWFLVIRVVQGESLVGDRQFWLTRPYRRSCLLGAKLLFIVSFVNLPVLIFNIVTLVRAGFSPPHYISGLAQAQLLLTALLILPILAISVVTDTIAQFLLAFLGVIVFIVGLSWTMSYVPSSSAGSGVPAGIALLIIACAFLTAIVLQYFRRDTRTSRLAILGSLLVAALIFIVAPYDRLMRQEYPQPTGSSFAPISAIMESPDPQKEDNSAVSSKSVSLTMMIDTSGLTNGSVVHIDAARLSIYAPNGQAWNSGWVESGRTVWPTDGNFAQVFNVTSKFYSSVAAEDVRLHVDLAVSQYREVSARSITATAANFSIMPGTLCIGEAVRESHEVSCRLALNGSSYTAHLNPLDTTCSLPDRTWPSLQEQRHEADLSDDFGGGVGLLPVRPFDIYFGEAFRRKQEGQEPESAPLICPGTQFQVATPELVGRYRVQTESQHVRLPNYRSWAYRKR